MRRQFPVSRSAEPSALSRSELRRYRGHLADELEQAALYRALAARATGEQHEVLLQLAAAEERHARYWQAKLGHDDEADVAGPPRRRTNRLLTWLARRAGVARVVPLLERIEAAEVNRYDDEPGAAAAMPSDERRHAQAVADLSPSWRARTSGSLRAAVFGVNDGLVSNLALIAGMAGGAASNETVLLAGLAGLAAGAGSMAAGEFISVKSQRELLDAGPNLGRQDRRHPDEPTAAPHDDFAAIGSPLQAAGSSFVAFAGGAAVPIAPYFVASGSTALAVAVLFAALALFAVGASISVLTTRPTLRSGLRQLAIGLVTAAGTYLVGAAVGRLVA